MCDSLWTGKAAARVADIRARLANKHIDAGQIHDLVRSGVAEIDKGLGFTLILSSSTGAFST